MLTNGESLPKLLVELFTTELIAVKVPEGAGVGVGYIALQ